MRGAKLPSVARLMVCDLRFVTRTAGSWRGWSRLLDLGSFWEPWPWGISPLPFGKGIQSLGGYSGLALAPFFSRTEESFAPTPWLAIQFPKIGGGRYAILHLIDGLSSPLPWPSGPRTEPQVWLRRKRRGRRRPWLPERLLQATFYTSLFLKV